MSAVFSDARNPLLNVTETAEELGCSTVTVKRLIKAGTLPAIRLPSPKGRGHLRIDRRDVKVLKAMSRV
jgi:excisionase family DNA binding protein